MHLQTIFRLFSPLRYLKISHEAKWAYDYLLPFVLAVISVVALFSVRNRPPFFGSTGVVTYVSEILKFLSPFYIAALAAVATFDSPSIKASFKGKKPYIIENERGELKRNELNRRQFLSLAFGYLALVSLLMYFLGYVAWIVSINISLTGLESTVVEICFSFAYLFVFYNLLTTTMLGLFYLSDRLHRDEE